MLGATQLTPAVIANIETGRRDDRGRRRREITIDELLVFAYALAAPLPVLLLPVGDEDAANITPNTQVSIEAALRWVLTDAPPPTPDGRVRDSEWWDVAAADVNLWKTLWRLLEELDDLRSDLVRASSHGRIDDPAMLEQVERFQKNQRDAIESEQRQTLSKIADQLALMRDRHLSPPAIGTRLGEDMDRLGVRRPGHEDPR